MTGEIKKILERKALEERIAQANRREKHTQPRTQSLDTRNDLAEPPEPEDEWAH